MEDKRAVALYMRLSVEDGDVNDSTKLESNSITNQRCGVQTRPLFPFKRNHLRG